MEVGEAVVALNLLADESELLVGALVTVEVSLVDLVDSASETISGELGTGGSSDKGLADSSVLEDCWGLDLVPLLLGEGIDDLLLVTLSALGQSLVLTNRHVGLMGPLDLKRARLKTFLQERNLTELGEGESRFRIVGWNFLPI